MHSMGLVVSPLPSIDGLGIDVQPAGKLLSCPSGFAP